MAPTFYVLIKGAFVGRIILYSFTNHPIITLFLFEVFMVFPSVALQPIQGFVLNFEGTHNQTHTFGRTPLHELSVCRTGRYLHNTRTREMNIHVSEEFEPAIPAINCLQTHALDRTAIGNFIVLVSQLYEPNLFIGSLNKLVNERMNK